ncbi:metal dependent phosphohydrolase /molybdenum cofactor cytidylyltransferase [Lachnotalea glycerini]|uniref:Metal dependent phosphohydrolase /molybdenum cofactor cytidylyltransferase n=1 Tax=Lachnotalea glycerini TaxID=1763509 RepID=A0A318EU29_9FIRM|nr:NTP transferase domain-containing protein [Lachnotalea glycerini]PXV93429.1 metal dependent phosphohydrolase /molybdenum cofactor cytidylyltransferase [Lachnotalea glycerini]
MKIKAVIAAAGCSLRMRQFKPLLDINGYPMIVWAVLNLKNAGVDEICVVTGRDTMKIERVLEAFNIMLIRNEAYQTTDMLTSIKIGLNAIMDKTTEGVFLLPGDNPMIHPSTIKALRQAFEKEQPSVLYPIYNKERTHPPLINSECFDRIMTYQGSGGLKHALHDFEQSSRQLELTDQGTSLDADYPGDYEELQAYANKYFGISKGLCEKIIEEVELPIQIKEHSNAVASLAIHMGEKLIQNGYALDLTIIESGALLHDILRTKPNHAAEGKLFLQDKGYTALADMVGNHMSLEHVKTPGLNEETIVYLADKLRKETKQITIKKRYEASLKYYKENASIRKRIENDIRKAEKLQEEYEVVTGEKLSDW